MSVNKICYVFMEKVVAIFHTFFLCEHECIKKYKSQKIWHFDFFRLFFNLSCPQNEYQFCMEKVVAIFRTLVVAQKTHNVKSTLLNVTSSLNNVESVLKTR